jgi:hypothetical protein
MTEKNDKQERVTFEAWLKREHPTAPLYRRDMVGSTRIGQYCASFVEEQWTAWQARAALAQADGQEPVATVRVFRGTKYGDVIDLATTGAQHKRLLAMDGAQLYATPPADHSEDARQMVPSASAKQAEPVYQVAYADEGGWYDATKKVYDTHPKHARRIVYAAPAPSALPAALTVDWQHTLAEAREAVDERWEQSNTMHDHALLQRIDALLAASPANHSGDSADMVASTPGNPYAQQGSLEEAWRRGFNGERGIAARGSNYYKVWKEGEAARKAFEAGKAATARQGVALSNEELGALVDDCLKITVGRKHPFGRDSHVWSDMQSVVNLILSRASSSRAEVERDRELLLNWIEEAVEYVGCTTWSPSLETEGRKILATLRASKETQDDCPGCGPGLPPCVCEKQRASKEGA